MPNIETILMLIKMSNHKYSNILNICPLFCEKDSNIPLEHFDFKWEGTTIMARGRCPKCGYETKYHGIIGKMVLAEALGPSWMDIK